MLAAQKHKTQSTTSTTNNRSKSTFIQPKPKLEKPSEKQNTEADKIPIVNPSASFFIPSVTPTIEKQNNTVAPKTVVVENSTVSSPPEIKKEAEVLTSAPEQLNINTTSISKPSSIEDSKAPKAFNTKKAPTKPIFNVKKDASKTTTEGKEKEKEDAKTELEHTTPRNPKEDPNFKKLEGRVETTAKTQQAHEPAETSAESAQSAAVSPANERESMAQSSQVETMNAAEPGTFDAVTFKEKLMKRIEGMQLPKNQDEADNFEDNNNIDAVNSSAAQDVSAEKTTAAGPVEETAKQKPDVAAVPERKIKPLPKAPIGSKPKSVNTTKAMPPKRGNAEVSKPLEDNMSEVDQQMSQNKVTDAQLAKSNEPQFMEGLDAKDKAKENTKSAPTQLRKQEQGILKSTQVNAKGKAQSKLADMHSGRAKLLNTVAGSQKQTGTKDTSERSKIATAIHKIYQRSKADVEKILNDLDTKVKVLFTGGTILAKRAFENHVDAKMTAYKARRYSGIIGAGKWIKDKFAGMPDEVNEFFVSGRQVYINTMDKVITVVAKLVAKKLTEAKTRVSTGKKEVQEYVQSLPKNLQKLGKEAAEDINDKFDELEDSVNSKQDALIDSLAEQYMEGLNAVDARIEEMKAANRGLIDKALGFINGIIETIKKLRDLIASLLAEIQNAMDVIMEDPIGFVSTLFDGVGKGIDLFMANIKKHLLGGFVTWLTGAMGPVGITIPDNLFSLEGVFSLVMQVLGLGWDFMRKKAVLLIGEPMVATMEKGFEMFQIIRTQGVSGMWKYVKEQFTDLKETIIESIKSMLITQVIEAGIKWLLSLLIPGAGFIKAIMAIKDLIVFFVESAIMLIPSLIQAIKALASGNVAGVSKAIEKGLAMLIPLVIGLFAKLIGLGGLVKKVQKIIKKVRKRIDRAVTKMIKKARKKFKKLVNKGKAGVKKLMSWMKKKVKFKLKNGESHRIFFKKTGKKYKLTIRSTEMPYQTFINGIDISKDPKLKGIKAKAINISKEIDKLSIQSITNKNKDNSVKIEKLMTVLMKMTSVLMEANKGSIENSIPVWGGKMGGYFGTSVRIDFLSTLNSSGSQADSNLFNKPYTTLNKRRGKSRPYYLRGHILNGDFHGPGNDWKNLTPLTYKANSLHKTRVEGKIRKKMKPGKNAFRYVVNVNYGRSVNESLINNIRLSGKPDASDIIEIIENEKYVPISLHCDVKEVDKNGNIVSGGLKVTEKIPNDIKQSSYADYKSASPPIPVKVNSGFKLSYIKLPNISISEIDAIWDNRPFVGKKSMSSKTGIPRTKIDDWYDNKLITFK